ncbi:unnamed protein product [Pleuronectes platessa]|uniref:VWFC domain-containing protein n=1 Tax=Pleuronectes platessa TaxID=8262 RepID=A0A9N7TJM2_PLEPL|nr:unnamed protein product [Pleuronectes platessa]
MAPPALSRQSSMRGQRSGISWSRSHGGIHVPSPRTLYEFRYDGASLNSIHCVQLLAAEPGPHIQPQGQILLFCDSSPLDIVFVLKSPVHKDNNTSWSPQSCQECTCFGDVSICKPPHCPNPRCDFQKGELLRFPANKCCPECIPSSQGSCQHEGIVYQHDSQWSPSPCLLCLCSGGSVSCTARPCPPLSCPADESPFTPAGECCPRCGRGGESCSWQGADYRDGEQWEPSLCSRCVCSNGAVQCSVAECQQVACKPHENLVIQPGRCCPQCVSNPCLSAGKQHQQGEQWQKNACTTCVCDRGQSRCHTQTCPPISCDKGQTKVKRAGQCCDECAAAKGSCRYEGVVRYHEDTWSESDCGFCTCSRGQVICRGAECSRLECPQGSELVRPDGKCCHECSSVKPSCVHEGKSYQDSAQWTDGSCRECECRDAQVTCYLRSCPTCPTGTLSVPQEGGCCPECHQVQCQADCLSCSGSPEHCESCRDPKAVLHLGRCLSVCPAGHYPEGRVCKACQSTCSTCSSRGTHDQSLCRYCHESCSECRGPTQQECVSCSDPAALLKDGECVPDCGAGFYSQDGVCHACDSSCASCFPDNPKCMSCPPATALHHGKCISQCPAQHYLDNHNRCRACHSSCASCWGPSVSQCSLCPAGLLLHQGQCVDACGEGLYSQDNTCHNCHPSCRSCVGPLASDCLRCLKPEEALLPQPGVLQPGVLQHGVCTAACPARSFLDHLQTCREERGEGSEGREGRGERREDRGQRTEETGDRREDRGEKTEGRGERREERIEGRGERREDRRQRGEERGERREERGEKTEGRGERTEDTGERREVRGAGSEERGKRRGERRQERGDRREERGERGEGREEERGERGERGEERIEERGARRGGRGGRREERGERREGERGERGERGEERIEGEERGERTEERRQRGEERGERACSRVVDSITEAFSLSPINVPCSTEEKGIMECDPTCLHCAGPSADNCTSCPSPSSLHEGQCGPSCPQGFFVQDSECQGCHPSCQSCSGPSQADCTSCPPLASLQSGYCRTSCQDGHFLNAATGECLKCSSDCQRCTADLQTGVGSVCLWCRETRTWLLGDHCTSQCPRGHYGWHGACMRCHSSCEACGGAGPLACTSCHGSDVLLASGLCAPRCPLGYFDNGHRICQACERQCQTCDMAGVCTSCRDPAKVLLFGECQYDSCAHQYYLNTTTRACRAAELIASGSVHSSIPCEAVHSEPRVDRWFQLHPSESSAALLRNLWEFPVPRPQRNFQSSLRENLS